MTPRNSPCPCGSGRKSKKCCTSPEARNAERDAAKERQRIALEEWDEHRRQERLKPRSAGASRKHHTSTALLLAGIFAGAAFNDPREY